MSGDAGIKAGPGRGSKTGAGSSRRASRTDAPVPTKSALRSELKEFTRERLILAALTAFAENGYRLTTVDSIVQLAGTTTTTFYRHFAGKYDLIEPLRQHLQEHVQGVLQLLDSPEVWTREGLRKWLDSYTAMWTDNQGLCEAYWEATHVEPDFARRAIPDMEIMIDSLTHLLAPLSKTEREPFRVKLSLLLLLADRAVYLAKISEADLGEAILDEFALILFRSFASD